MIEGVAQKQYRALALAGQASCTVTAVARAESIILRYVKGFNARGTSRSLAVLADSFRVSSISP